MKRNIEINEKTPKTINFDKLVLMQLEKRCKEEGTSVSNFVNFLVKQAVFKDDEYYKLLAKHHLILFHYYKDLKDGVIEE